MKANISYKYNLYLLHTTANRLTKLKGLVEASVNVTFKVAELQSLPSIDLKIHNKRTKAIADMLLTE